MKPASYLSNLTPLRGIAALLTVIFHTQLMLGGALVNQQATGWLGRMYLMVDFFFILSGFILCHVYGSYFSEKVTKASFKKFTIARFARVYPLHLVTLVYTILLFAVSAKLGIPKTIMEIENSNYSVLTNLLLLQSMNLHQWFTWVHASWSISTEWWAYMIFPFLVRPFMNLNTIGRVVVCAVCFVGYLCITYLLVPVVTEPPSIPFVRVNPADLSINVSYQFGFVRCLCGFVLGMMMYQGFKQDWGKKILGNGITILLLTAAAFTCMHFNLPDIISVSFFPLVLLAGAYGSDGMNKFFGSKPLQRLGDWSFSIYLVHQPLMFTIGSIMSYLNTVDPNKTAAGPPPPLSMVNAWLICMGFIALVLMVSYLTYCFLEKPSRRWINTLAEKQQTSKLSRSFYNEQQ